MVKSTAFALEGLMPVALRQGWMVIIKNDIMAKKAKVSTPEILAPASISMSFSLGPFDPMAMMTKAVPNGRKNMKMYAPVPTCLLYTSDAADE